MSDPIVDQVIAKFQSRSDVGTRKYGTTLQSNNKDNYLLHLQEELMDACNYIEKLMTQTQQLIELVRNTPNDSDLGRKIRDMVR
jgi:hypothetical protein